MQSQHLARILEALPPGTEVKARGSDGIITRSILRVEVAQGERGLEVTIITVGDAK